MINVSIGNSASDPDILYASCGLPSATGVSILTIFEFDMTAARAYVHGEQGPDADEQQDQELATPAALIRGGVGTVSAVDTRRRGYAHRYYHCLTRIEFEFLCPSWMEPGRSIAAL